MKSNVRAFTAMVLVFLCLLALSGISDGIISELIYLCAYILPMAIGFFADREARRKESEHDREYKEPENLLKLSVGATRTFLPIIFPTVAMVLGFSYATSLVISMLGGGVQSLPDVGDNIVFAIIRHAFVPALLEEALFRYMPIRMLARHSVKATIVLSTLYFALVHNSFYSFPYALAAGAVFITLDIVCESIWPSVILHFINNVASVLWIMYSGVEGFSGVYYAVIFTLSLISLVIIFIRRRQYADEVSSALSYGDPFTPSREVVAIAFPTLIIAISEFL